MRDYIRKLRNKIIFQTRSLLFSSKHEFPSLQIFLLYPIHLQHQNSRSAPSSALVGHIAPPPLPRYCTGTSLPRDVTATALASLHIFFTTRIIKQKDRSWLKLFQHLSYMIQRQKSRKITSHIPQVGKTMVVIIL